MTEESLTAENQVQSTELVIPETLPVAVEPKLPPRRQGLPPFFWAVLGIGIGVAGTLAAVSARRDPRPKMVAQVTPPSTSNPATNPTSSLGSGLTPPGATVPGGGTTGATVGGTAVKDPPEAPMNPFGGSSFVLPKVPAAKSSPGASPLSGMILPKQLPVLPPTSSTTVTPAPQGFGAPTGKPGSAYINKLIAQGVPKAPAALKTPSIFTNGDKKPAAPAKTGEKSTLVTVNQLANDRQAAADDLIAYVQKIGGKAQPLTEQGSEGKPEVKGVLATVPEGVVKDLLKHVSDAGAVVDKQTWTGSSNDRKAKLVEDAQSRIASLKKLREALLVTYLEDAQPVKDVDEEIAKATKGLDQLQTDKGAEKMAIVRISFVNKS
jgi:hypothetical protein